jgi:hypothetical protein
MRRRPHHIESMVPRTNVGRWMRAILLRQYELRDQLRPTLNNGNNGWNDDEPAVFQAASEITLRQYFGTEYDVRAVTDFVAKLQEAAKNDVQFSRLKTEAVIREALGEADVDTSGIRKGERFNIHLISIAMTRGGIKFTEKEADQLVVEAERIAFDRGWHPPLAD